ncbi:hypothetical protein [Luteibacter sp. 9135]|uniref:hypothetical protein n=1 Tax=Luteibacter sp. 9135 TaxID=1500893 RepID=UPI00056998B7|nr:hypothetical protein [Luteibacter sp. 9135]
MGAVVALSDLVEARQVWRGRAAPVPAGDQPTGLTALDAALPTAGWPDAVPFECFPWVFTGPRLTVAGNIQGQSI